MQLRDEVDHAVSQAWRVGGQERLRFIEVGTHKIETLRQGNLERRRAAHGLVRERGHGCAHPAKVRELVQALVDGDGAVHVKAHSRGVPKRLLRGCRS